MTGEVIFTSKTDASDVVRFEIEVRKHISNYQACCQKFMGMACIDFGDSEKSAIEAVCNKMLKNPYSKSFDSVLNFIA